MSISDTRQAQRYASIAEVAAAQCKIYTEEARLAPEYTNLAKEYAEIAEISATSAQENATQAQNYAAGASSNASISQEYANSALGSSQSASNYAVDAASSADSAEQSAQEAQENAQTASAAVNKTIRVSDTNLSPLGNAADRIGKVLTFNSSGNVQLIVPASGSAADVLNVIAEPDGSDRVGYGDGTITEQLNKVDGKIGATLSFSTGGRLESQKDFILFDTNSTLYYWTGSYPKDVAPLSTPTNTGGVASGAWAVVGDSEIRAMLLSSLGASNIGLNQGGKVQDAIKYVTPEMFVSVSADVTAAIQLAFDNGSVIDMSGRDWTIVRKITVRDGTEIKLGASSITCGMSADTPLFDFRGTDRGLLVTGGRITGTCSAVFYFQGTTPTPSQSGHYARNIRIYGTYATSDTINDFIYMKDAVRQVFLDSCFSYVKNGITASGKCVEIGITKCIFNSGTADTTTARITLQSPAGSTYYNEGWHFTDCTIDGAGKSFNVSDIYTLTINGGFIGGEIAFGQPTTTHCRELVIGKGVVMKGTVTFTPTGAYDYRAYIGPAVMYGNGATGNIIANSGASGINVDTKLESSGVATGTGVIFRGLNTNCNVSLSGDNTYDRLVSFQGSGERCSVTILSYLGSSHPIYTERAVKIISSPVTDAEAASQVMLFTPVAETTFAVGATIASRSVTVQKGATGEIVIAVALTGMTAATQALTVGVPTGMVLPSGSGWNSAVIRPQVTAGYVSLRIPFYCTADIASGNIILQNNTGTTVTAVSNSYIGYVLR